MKCPICNNEFDLKASKDKPFCSSRCKDIDLGNWLTEGYSIPAVELDDEEINELEKALGNKDEQ